MNIYSTRSVWHLVWCTSLPLAPAVLTNHVIVRQSFFDPQNALVWDHLPVQELVIHFIMWTLIDHAIQAAIVDLGNHLEWEL